MVFVRSLIFLVALATGVSAFALTDKQLTDSYNSCDKFLKLSYDKEQEIAAKTSYTVREEIDACQLITSTSLKEYIRRSHQAEAEIARAKSHPAPQESSASESTEPEKPPLLPGCIDIGGGNQSCGNNTCINIGGGNLSCGGDMGTCINIGGGNLSCGNKTCINIGGGNLSCN